MIFFSRRLILSKLTTLPFILFFSKSYAQNNKDDNGSSKKDCTSDKSNYLHADSEVIKANETQKVMLDELVAQRKKIHFLMENPSVSFDFFLDIHDGSVDATPALKAAAASGKTIVFPSNGVYSINQNDIAISPFTKFIGPDGGYATFLVNSTEGSFGTFDLRNKNGLGDDIYSGGYFNVFRNLRFRYPGQIKNLTDVASNPIAYLPLFFGGGYSSRFEYLDIGNAYIGFVLGGKGLGSCSRIVLKDIIGAPIFLGLSIEQVRDIPIIQNISWNYNYLDLDKNHSYGNMLKQWMALNATAFQFGRCDWASCINLFSYGYYKNLVIESRRYTGSADRIKFIGCFSDQSIHPLWVKDFENQLDFIACGFTGVKTNVKNASGIFLSTKSINANVSFTNCTFNSYYMDIIISKVNVNMYACQFYNYGFGSKQTSPASAISIDNDNVTVNIVNTDIDASAGEYVRCLSDGGYSGCLLNITGCSNLTGSKFEIFRWDSSSSNVELISQDSYISGAYDDIVGVSSLGITAYIPRRFYLESLPLKGTFKEGDYIVNTKPSGTKEDSIIKGWVRMTTGHNNQLNIDWVEDKLTK
ncbi:hypothetical protein ACKQC9_30300 [Klebsiella michiganensis]|uniref:hypothetical protein n=1 Tax=Klebsiella michiganensis TaxID=1134687 RepID=UPI00141D065F|nr:hypothetical protein [Klebsiella michiganensis]CAB1215754.1 hypothetical protein SFB9_2179 [Klebsiella michiganensis]HDT5905203.1 hypothetical protein [Klebsiella michiganensis]HDT5950152.1 hypothetical protein [Klebsiella michiganensis]HDT5972564.1 hypothetical protein [Klebsiella michiganensis]HDT5982810.1 hypothetical protein [Klebsiella michiganensis]